MQAYPLRWGRDYLAHRSTAVFNIGNPHCSQVSLEERRKHSSESTLFSRTSVSSHAGDDCAEEKAETTKAECCFRETQERTLSKHTNCPALAHNFQHMTKPKALGRKVQGCITKLQALQASAKKNGWVYKRKFIITRSRFVHCIRRTEVQRL